MGGGLMQLVAYGAQDIYLTGNPQITFFKVVYRRHTNFSMECIEQTFNGTPDFGKKVSVTISRNGDLIHKMFIRATLPPLALSSSDTQSDTFNYEGINLDTLHWVNWVGLKLIKHAEVEIGGQRIDRIYGEWMFIWNELTQNPGQERNFARMVGNVPMLTQTPIVPAGANDWTTLTIPQFTLYIPLIFWFCRNPGLALPLIALQYHDTKINVEFADADECIVATTGGVDQSSSVVQAPGFELSDVSLWVDYIYLDTDERRRFAQVAHEYLIEQLQFPGSETLTQSSAKIKLPFNHPVKEIVWVTRTQGATNTKQWFNFTTAVDYTNETGIPNDPYGGGMFGPLFMGQGLTLNPLTSPGVPTDPSFGQWNSFAFQNASYPVGFNNVITNKWYDTGLNPTKSGKILLNGQDRFSEQPGEYFNYMQPYNHHSRGPEIGINVYSFALRPEDHQPSGTCNFSRIDTATLQLAINQSTFNASANASADTYTISPTEPATLDVYAVNYNVLRIMSGMGGLAYSN